MESTHPGDHNNEKNKNRSNISVSSEINRRYGHDPLF